MITFEVAESSYKPGEKIIAIMHGKENVGAIYSTRRGIEVVCYNREIFEEVDAIKIGKSQLSSQPSVLINFI